MQVRLDGQVGSTQRLHQSLPQIALVLQDVLEMSAEHLQHPEPPSCRTHTSSHTDQSHDGTLMWRRRSLRWNVCVTSALFFSSFRSSTFSCSCNRCYRWVTTSVTFSLGQISAGPPKRTSSSCFCILIRCCASCSCGEKLGLSPAEAESKSSWRRTESGSQACAITF